MKTSRMTAIKRAFRCAALIAMVTLTGCAVVRPDRDVPRVQEALRSRGLPEANLTAVPPDQAVLESPIDRELALALAFRHSPRILELYADLGATQSELIEASRLPNPEISYSRLEERDSDAAQITRGVSVPFSDLLLLPFRSRLAGATFDGERERISGELVELASEVEAGWLEYVTAQQVAEMRKMSAEASGASAELARQLHAAGNISQRTLALELADAERARIESARAGADALRARAEFAALLGLRTRDSWQTVQRLPAPLSTRIEASRLEEQALEERLDLSAARRQAAAAETALRFTRRWRWLGLVQVGYESESETDGARLRGPSISWEVPLFNWGGSTVLKLESASQAAQAELTARETAVRNEVALALDRMETAQSIAEGYRAALLPQLETVVARTFEEYNYMLADAFELLQAKRETYEAYQEYLEAVRDFWLARAELRRAVGGRLADDGAATADTVGVETLPAPQRPSGEASQSHPHSHHEGSRP